MSNPIPDGDHRPEVDLDDSPPMVVNGSAAPDQAPSDPESRRTAGIGHPIGRVGAPRGAEATSETFSVWVGDDQVVEKTQLVRTDTEVGGRPVHMYGLVAEVSRRSRRADILEESDRYDNDPEDTVATTPGGVTFAQVRVLASKPVLLAPPREESPVYAADPEDAAVAYGMAEMAQPVSVGLVRNGGEATAGQAKLDLDYLLGALGGHCNVTGMAGVGTKSSFLTVLAGQIQHALAAARSAGTGEAQARVVILNVKGFDLFWLDHWSTGFTEADAAMWTQMGQSHPRPLDVTLHAPQAPGSNDLAVATGRDDVTPYSWSLADVAAGELFPYLFGDGERDDDNFALLLGDLERVLVQERTAADGAVIRTLRPGGPAQSFRQLLEWFEAGVNADSPSGWDTFNRGSHHSGTLRRFHRRLRRIVYESAGIFRLDSAGSHPLDITRLDPTRPAVIDIQSLPDRHHQRFVVAALLNQAVNDQTGPGAVRGMHYLFVLDELNRFAPKGQSDPITKLIETVAAELRSRGVILLGAQQQASLVSTRVVDNSAIRVLGRTGGQELRSGTASFLPSALTSFVETMGGGDKVINAPTFRQPMIVRLPRPPWAMRRQEATQTPPSFLGPDATPVAPAGPRRIRPRNINEVR